MKQLETTKEEKMEQFANTNMKRLSYFTYFLVLPLFMNGQYSKTKLSGPFTYKGNSVIKLTEDSSRQLLINDLTTGAFLSSQNETCHSDIGFYLFNVDSKGKIHEKDIVYFGTLVDSTQESILSNIKKTSGKYLKPAKNSRQKEHLYLFEYLSKGYKYGCYDNNCDEEILRIEYQLKLYKRIVWAILEKVKVVDKKVTIIKGSSYDEAIKKGLIAPPEIIIN
jgi:hypothetical protein